MHGRRWEKGWWPATLSIPLRGFRGPHRRTPIVVGAGTFRATRDIIEYRYAEAVEVQGKSEPVPVWQAIEARARVSFETPPSRAQLVGRRRELDLLVDAFSRARAERVPQLVTLVGVPGIGKSRLVYELAQVLESDQELIFWRQGRSPPYGEGVTYAALAEIVKAQAGILDSDPAHEVQAKLDAAAQEIDVGEPERERLVVQLGRLVGVSPDTDRSDDRQGTDFVAWRRFLEALAERGPLVLVFEDLHWAEENLLDFVDHLVDWASGVPLLVVGTARPELLERRPGWGGGKPNALTVSLSPLSVEETASLIEALLDRPALPAELQSGLLDRAGGNPLYAEQFVRMLGERPSGDGLPLPETVQGIIAARLDSLPADEKELLQDAAVVGKVFWPGALGDRDRSWLDERLHRLERKQFVVRERRSTVAGEDEFAFRHVLVREVAYGQIPRADRAAKHRRVAEWIDAFGRREDDAEMLAHHYSTALALVRAAGEADPVLEAQTRSALCEAGDRALGLHAYLAAAQFYGRALQLWPLDDPERARILSRYGRALVYGEARGTDELAEALDALLAAGETETAAEAAAWLGTMHQEEGRGEEARRELRRARELVEPLPPSRAKGEVLGNVSRSLMMADEHAEAISVGEQALMIAETLGNEELEAHALINIGSARIGVDPGTGRAEIEEGITIAIRIGSVEAARGYGNLASLLVDQGDLRGAWKAQEQASELAQRFGAWWFTRWLRAERIFRFFFEGRWDELCEAAEETIAEPTFNAIPARSIRAQVRLARDDVSAAAADAREAVQLALRAEDLQIVLPTLADAAFVLCGAGEREEAAAQVEDVLRRWRERDALSNWLWAPKLAATLLELGRADEFVQAARRASSNAWMGAALALAREDFQSAADRYAEIGSLPDEAYARLRAAERLVGEGKGAGADVQLHRALAFWRSVVATRYIREGERLLGALEA